MFLGDNDAVSDKIDKYDSMKIYTEIREREN